MLKAIIELRNPINWAFIITKNPEIKDNILSDLEWQALKLIKLVLEVFLRPSTRLEGQLYITLPESLLYIYSIYNKLEKLKLDFFSKK
jgi:hypothetical protein